MSVPVEVMAIRDVDTETSLSASPTTQMASSGAGGGGGGGIDNVCLTFDKYLDDLEKSMMSDKSNKSMSSYSRRSYNNTMTTTESHIYSTVSKRLDGPRRHSLQELDEEREKKDFVTSIAVDSEGDSELLDYDPGSLQLVWRNLSYSTTPSLLSRSRGTGKTKRILDRQNGQAKGGQITAIIGPSGAGKSTLLECLAGRRKTGLKGDIYVSYDRQVMASGVKLSLIGQKDEAIKNLTVREILTFATRIKNYDKVANPLSTARLVASILSELSLEKCADTFASKISGGQLKRLVFGVELISGPDIILLDEPTSGLDSSSAFHCIQLLKKLTDLKNRTYHGGKGDASGSFKAPLIMCSIHQPSARVLNNFHQVYVLSSDGRCIFQGSPYALLAHLSKFNLHCPQFHNPADFIIELASGDYGLEPVNRLAVAESDRQLQVMKSEKLVAISDKFAVNFHKPGIEVVGGSSRIYIKVSKVVERMKKEPFPIVLHTWLLLNRTITTNFREPKLTWFRLLQAVFVGVLMAFLYDHYIGEPDGCFPVTLSVLDKSKSTEDNVAFIFFITLFTVMASMMPTVLTFPSEVAVLLQERNNGWYSCATYYVAKVLADTPLQILITLVFVSIIYPLTGQISDWPRFGLFCLVSLLISSIAQCVGIFFGTYYVHSVENAVFLAPLSMAPVFLLSGFFGKLSTIPIFLKPFARLSYVRYAFEALIVILYGLGRCPDDDKSPSSGALTRVTRQIFNTGFASANEIDVAKRALSRKNISRSNAIFKISPSSNYGDKTSKVFTLPKNLYPNSSDNFTNLFSGQSYVQGKGSYVMKHFELTDDTLWQNLIVLVGFLLFLRLLCYVVLVWKTNRRK